MPTITVNQVRVRLGKVVEKVFTEDFANTYACISPQFSDPDKAGDCFATFLEATEAYIKVVSQHLDDLENLKRINLFVHDLVVFCVFARYHFVTTDLVDREQSEKLDIPSDDAEFFEYMMLDYLDRLRFRCQ